ncbi:putative cytochrome P450 120 [Dysidea avara]|uniref:putative cytochrome P450 120 n=1 Tax=Dysidea avara TaxID=196820 RepID=UPI0033254EE8
MNPPGSIGYPLIGDSSIEFIRDPHKYVQKRKEQHGDIFRGRIGNKPTFFATSNKSACEMLQEKSCCFEMGYKEFVFDLFDQNIIFQNGHEWQEVRTGLDKVFTADKVKEYMEMAKPVISGFLSSQDFPVRQPVPIYKTMKKLSTQLTTALFLGATPGQPEADEVSELMTTHWRGVVSVPVSIRLPGAWWRSSYNKALLAKDGLLKVVEKTAQSDPSSMASKVVQECPNKVDGFSNMLVFVSAVIPKALASLLTSFVMELSKPSHSQWLNCHENEAELDDVMLEVERLWPPFFGGGRMCTEDCQVAGFNVSKDHRAAYITSHANKDPTCFADPHKFQPDRWQTHNVTDREIVLTFGGGPRQCIGKVLAQKLLRECARQLLASYTWELTEASENVNYKTLPVLRPLNDNHAVFKRKQ